MNEPQKIPEGELTPDYIYGLMAEFDRPEDLVTATERAYQEGYRVMDAYTPFPVEGLTEALHMPSSRLPLIVLGGGILGAAAGYGMQYYASVIDYPLNVGGRPLHSWPLFVPITFELAILFAAFAAVLGMLALNGLPQPYHPVFNVPHFEMASRSHFFLAIEARDPRFHPEETRRFLESLGANLVSEIER
jgi:hypothetical protein